LMKKIFQSLSRGFSGESTEKAAVVLSARGKSGIREQSRLLDDDGQFNDIDDQPFVDSQPSMPLTPLPRRLALKRTTSQSDSWLHLLPVLKNSNETPFYPLTVPLTCELIQYLKKDRLSLLSLRETCKYLLVILDESFLRFEVFLHEPDEVQETLENTVCSPSNISVNFGFFDRSVFKHLPKTLYSINLFQSSVDDDSLLLVPPSLKSIKLDFCRMITNVGLKNLFLTTKDSLFELTLRGNQHITHDGLQFLSDRITHLCLLDMKPIGEKGLKCLPEGLVSLEITNNNGELKFLSTLPVFRSITTLELDGTKERDLHRDHIELPPNLFSLTLAKHFLSRSPRFPKSLKRFFVTGAADEITDEILLSLPITLEVLNVGKAKMNMRRLPAGIERLSTLSSLENLASISKLRSIKLLIISGELVSLPRCFEYLPPSLNTLIFHKVLPDQLQLATLPPQVSRLNMTFRESTPTMTFVDLPKTVRHLTLAFERDSKFLSIEELAHLAHLDVLELFSRSVEDEDVFEAFEDAAACVRLNGVWIKT